jgi:hypothetical protein
VHGGDDAHEEIEADASALLQSGLERLCADARDADLTVGFILELVVNVVRELTVDADRLQLVKYGVARAFEHSWNL